jgi:AraC-like DNA-binding protein
VEIRLTEQSHESYKNHSHQQLSVGIVTSGKVTMKVAGKEYFLETGAVVIIGPEVVHSCNPQEGSRSYLMLYLDINWCLALQQELLGESAGLYFPEHPVVTDPDLVAQALTLAKSFGDSGFALEKSEQLTRFFGNLLLKSSHLPRHKISEPPHVIAAIKDHLSRCLEENFTLQQLAVAFGYNPFYLLRSFKKNVGFTPHEYRLNLRIDRAKELLRAGKSPAAVAAETGFVDQSHFHRTFRQFVAATPRQYQLRS